MLSEPMKEIIHFETYILTLTHNHTSLHTLSGACL